jgi:hypothetical protein
MDQEKKKERPQLGLAIPVTNKNKASSYDLKGNIMIDGKSYRFGAYKAQAKGNGKLAAGADYYYFHRVEPMDADKFKSVAINIKTYKLLQELAQKKFELPLSMSKTMEFFIQKGHQEFKADADKKAK